MVFPYEAKGSIKRGLHNRRVIRSGFIESMTVPLTTSTDPETSSYTLTDDTSFQHLTDERSTGRKRPPPAVVHPIFERCLPLVDDPYWRSLLSQAARGKFPRGFTYRGNVLYHRRGSRTVNITLPTDDAVSSLGLTLTFFRNQGGLRSSLDHDRDRQAVDDQLRGHLAPLTWDAAKRHKGLKDLLINGYVKRMVIQYQLDPSETERLRTLIHMGLMSRQLDHGITIANYEIVDIEGLVYDPIDRRFRLETTISPHRVRSSSRHRPDEHVSPLSFLHLWRKFLATFMERLTSEGGALYQRKSIEMNSPVVQIDEPAPEPEKPIRKRLRIRVSPSDSPKGK